MWISLVNSNDDIAPDEGWGGEGGDGRGNSEYFGIF